MNTGKVRASRNALLRRLTPDDQALLEPDLELVSLARNVAVIQPADLLDQIYFPDTALMALEESSATGRPIEIGLVGWEGMIGWPLLLGCPSTSHTAVVQMRSGTAWRISWSYLQRACLSSRTLAAHLLRFVDIVMIQMAQMITSHLQHALDRRLARFLLMRHDRISGDNLSLYHDDVAASLHVRRASVTDQLHILEGERLLRCRRGSVTIRDRQALENYAGDAYGQAEARYRAMIGPFGKSPSLLAH